MKTLLFLLINLPFTFLNEKLDRCNGIENYIFGTSKDQFKNITLEIEQGNAQLYTVNSSTISISGVQLDYIGISFIKNKLSAIAVSTKNATGSIFFKYLKDNYGPPVKTKNQFEWRGKHITIVFQLYKNNKDAAIDFYSK